jgi:L-asparaginase
MTKKIVFLGMGGTIAGTANSASDNVGYKAAQLSVAQLLLDIPGLDMALDGHTLVSEQVAQLNSKDMGWAQWSALALRAGHYLALPDMAGLVITHGTDTLEETAYFLSCVLPADLLASKPVVLTCAMRPATSLAPDGPQNMRDAVVVTRAEAARGVLVVCAGTIHSARDVQKVHTYRPDAFSSGDVGPLGFVEEGVVRWVHRCPEAGSAGFFAAVERMRNPAWPRVEIIMSYAGATGATVRALCAASVGGAAPVRGIVVAGTGNGTVHEDLEVALLEMQSQGIRVVRASRCAFGRVVEGESMTSGLPHSNGLPPLKARVALMLDLMMQDEI